MYVCANVHRFTMKYGFKSFLSAQTFALPNLYAYVLNILYYFGHISLHIRMYI